MQSQSITSASLFPDELTKTCTVCKNEKSLVFFSRRTNKRMKHDRSAVCRECRGRARREDYAASRISETKTCRRCHSLKPVEQFGPHAQHLDGKKCICLQCESKRTCRQCGAEKPSSSFGKWSRQCNVCKRVEWKRWHKTKRGKASIRKAGLKARFGMTPEQYDALLSSQGGVCAICGKTPDPNAPRRFHVDHCHRTGRIRGILCNSCNAGIGHLKDDLEVVEKAAAYLRRAFSPSTDSRDSVGNLVHDPGGVNGPAHSPPACSGVGA